MTLRLSCRIPARFLLLLGCIGALSWADLASAETTIIATAPGCVPPDKTIVIPGSGFTNPVPWDVTTCPAGLQYYAAGGGQKFTVFGDAIVHEHAALVASPPGGSYGPFDIISGPYKATNGFALYTLLDGFASYQGDPGGEFTWTATLTATYLGGISTVTSSGRVTGSPQQKIHLFDLQQYPGVSGVDIFLSRLTIATSGIGELHLERTGEAALAIPEPATWAILITGFGLIGAALRRRERAVAADPT